MVACTCNPSNGEAEAGGAKVKASLGSRLWKKENKPQKF